MKVVILAAGASKRMGQPKGLVRLASGQTWLAQQCASIAAAGLVEATLVLGDDHGDYLSAHSLSFGERAQFFGLALLPVRNANPSLGPFSSLRCALGDDACFVLPIDTPAPPAAVWSALTARVDDGALAAIPCHEGRGGHPVLLAAAFVRALREVPLDSGEARLDVQLRALPLDRVARVAVDCPAVIENLNTPEAFRHWAQASVGARER